MHLRLFEKGIKVVLNEDIVLDPEKNSGSCLVNKAVFFDRDGVINVDHGYVGDIAKFDFIKGVKEALADIKAAGFLTAHGHQSIKVSQEVFTLR